MAQDEVILDGDLSLDIPLDGDAQLDLQLDGAVGLLTLIEAGIAQIIFNDDYTITFVMTDGRRFTTGSIRGAVGEKGDKGDKGDTGERGEKGEQGERGLQGETGAQGIQGERGIQGEQGIQGVKGDTGEKGDKGDAFTYADFTPEQLASLKGEKGDKGDAFEYSDFTPQQLASLKGEKGDKGEDGQDYVLTENDKQEIAGLVDVSVDDVQINGTSVVNNGIANVPLANSNTYGVVKIGQGLRIDSNNLVMDRATDAQVQAGVTGYRPITPINQHQSVFYGLAKVAGHDESASSNAVGTYTPEALVAIQKMLGVYQAPFRTIKEIAITEETKTVYVNSDSDNEPFSLSEVVIFIEAIANNNGSGFFVINHGNVKLSSAELTTKPFASAANIFVTTERKHVVHMWISGNRFFGETMDNTGSGYSKVNKQATRQSMGFCECDSITELFIYSPNDFKFTSGTITIIGR